MIERCEGELTLEGRISTTSDDISGIIKRTGLERSKFKVATQRPKDQVSVAAVKPHGCQKTGSHAQNSLILLRKLQLGHLAKPSPRPLRVSGNTHRRSLQDRGASAKDERDHEGCAWPPIIRFSMMVARQNSLLIASSFVSEATLIASTKVWCCGDFEKNHEQF